MAVLVGYCEGNSSIAQAWVQQGFQPCFFFTLVPAVLLSVCLLLGALQYACYARFGRAMEPKYIPRSPLYRGQVLLSLLLALQPFGGLLWQGVGLGRLYGYMLLHACLWALSWGCAIALLQLEHTRALAAAALGKPSPVKVLSDGMWRDLLEGEWMVEFYAPWCPACQNLQPEWEKFAEWGEDLGVNVAKVDVTEQPGLSGRFVITALPTIYHCKDGEFRRYQGARTKTDFINFINDQEWKSIEPVSSWFGPSSFLMSSMSALFQLSMWIRHGHGYLTENLGIPVWGSYAIFGLATLFSGLILGLMMVFLADCICPSKRHRAAQYPQSRKLSPEAGELLKKLDEGQEADEEDNSDDETEGKEVSNRDSSPRAVRQRLAKAAAPLDQS